MYDQKRQYPIIIYPSLIKNFYTSELKRKKRLEKKLQNNHQLPRRYSSHSSTSSNWLTSILNWVKHIWNKFRQKPKLSQLPKSQPPRLQRSQRSTTSRSNSLDQLRRLEQCLKGKVMQPTKSSSAQRGVSEEKFYHVLRQYFPVEFGGEFPIPNSKYAYSADLQIVYKCGLAVDIEIDEPYEGRSLEPHHCIDQGKDLQRNKFFISGNWIVIRFAEIQVVKYPYECAVVVDHVLSKALGGKPRLKPTERLPVVNVWTIKEAKKMAKSGFRQTYLPGWKTPSRKSGN